MKKTICTIIAMLAITISITAQQKEFPKLTGPYLGQKPPGMTPEIFAPGVISKESSQEFAGTFAPDGKAFYFTRRPEYDDFQAQRIWFTREINGKWTEPEPAPFSENCMELEPSISPDGQRLYFGSSRPLPGEKQYSRMPAIWIMKKNDDVWGDLTYFAPMMMYISEAGNRDIYYTDLAMGGCVAVKRWDGMKYGPGERLPETVNYVNSPTHPFIARDQSFLLYDGEVDDVRRVLYVSFKQAGGTWSQGVQLGNGVNTRYGEMCPSISPDGKYLFFESDRAGKMDIYWVDAKIIEELKPINLK